MSIARLFEIVCIIWVASEIILALMLRSNKTDSAKDKKSLQILWTTICISITLGVIIAIKGIGFVRHLYPTTAFIGLFFVLFGLAVRWIAILTLRRYFTVNVAIRKDHKIVNRGLYKTVRHPAYSGSLLSFFGLALYFTNWLSFLIIFVPITAAFLYRIKIEEEVLGEQFGRQYLNYMKKTKRLVPFVW